MKYPLLLRILVTAFVAIAVLIPINMIEGKIAERRSRAEQVVAQFAAETSGPQLVLGPFIALTCEQTVAYEHQVMHEGKAETTHESRVEPCATAFFAPRSFRADATMPVETLHRGLYSIRLYRSKLQLDGELDWPAAPSAAGAISREWKQAYLVTYVSDPRGIKEFASSTPSGPLLDSGDPAIEHFSIRERLGPWSGRKPGTSIAFSYKLALTGTSSLMIAPVGDRSDIHIASDWPHPSFSADWSPDAREVRAQGTDARWRMSSVATGGDAAWSRLIGAGKIGPVPAAGISLFDPVNIYTLSYRATEYAFLFVMFTFGALALAEVLAGVTMHAMQYLLVGLAIAVFFLLLVALTEHIAFYQAYGAAAAACIALLTFYLRHPLGTARRTAAFFALFVVLYAALYEVLQSEDNALLMGSVLTFFLLAFTMAATRKLDWRAVSRQLAPFAATKPAAT